MQRPSGVVDFTPDPELFPFESRWFDSSVGPIHYIDEGEGRPLILFHGNPDWSFLYRNMVIELRDRFRCIAMDYPGFGLSAHPGDGYGYTELERYAKDIRKELSVVEGVARVDLWGEQTKVVYLDVKQSQLSQLGITDKSVVSTLNRPVDTSLYRCACRGPWRSSWTRSGNSRSTSAGCCWPPTEASKPCARTARRCGSIPDGPTSSLRERQFRRWSRRNGCCSSATPMKRRFASLPSPQRTIPLRRRTRKPTGSSAASRTR